MNFHPRRAACWILGLWLGASAFMIGVATRNFRSVDTLIGDPSPGMRDRLQRLGADEVRLLLRHQASELNQLFFSRFELAELVLAVVLVVLAFAGLRTVPMMKPVAVLLLILLAVEHFILTPEITRLGRSADFRILQSGTPEHHRFWTFHGAYSSVELVKLALLVLASARLLWSNGRKAG